MLIVVYGEDTFRVQEKVRVLRQAFLEKFDPTGINLSEFPSEGAKLDVGSILQSACSFPFLAQKRMVIIKGLIDSIKATEKAVWIQGFARIPESTLVVFWEPTSVKALEKKALFKAFSTQVNVHTYAFNLLAPHALEAWVTDRFAQHQITIERSALLEFTSRVGADLWRMQSEISKLVAYASGIPVSRKMVEDLVQESFEGKIFELMDAVSQRDSERAFRLLSQEREAGSADFYLLSMFARQIRLLIGARALLDEQASISSQEVAKRLSIHPFVAKKVLDQARGFTLLLLKEAQALLYTFDRGTKTGQISAPLSVDLLTATLLS